MSPLLIGIALLCGIPPGFIAGVIVGARMFRKVHPNTNDIDYSGGI